MHCATTPKHAGRLAPLELDTNITHWKTKSTELRLTSTQKLQLEAASKITSGRMCQLKAFCNIQVWRKSTPDTDFNCLFKERWTDGQPLWSRCCWHLYRPTSTLKQWLPEGKRSGERKWLAFTLWGWEQFVINQTNIEIVSRATLNGLLREGVECHRGLSKPFDTILRRKLKLKLSHNHMLSPYNVLQKHHQMETGSLLCGKNTELSPFSAYLLKPSSIATCMTILSTLLKNPAAGISNSCLHNGT